MQNSERNPSGVAGPSAGTSGVPVFVVGAARSGTTLLYSVILASDAFPVYRAESRIMECATRYGSLTAERNFRRFAADFSNSRQFARSGLEPEALWNAPRESRTSYSAFLHYFMASIAAREGKERWIEKSPNHLLHMRELATAFPSALFVHAVRDGRSVAVSQRRLRFDRAPSDDPLVQLVWAAKHWEVMVNTGRQNGRALGPRYLEVRYEDLLGEPGAVVSRLSEFLDVDLSLERVQNSDVGALGRANTAFGENLTGLSDKALNRWEAELDDDEKNVVHWAVGGTLRDFGYAVPEPGSARVPLRAAAHARLYPLAMRTKRMLNRYTPVGRVSRKPLEIGLT